MLGFFVAFAVKLPAVPLHTWLPDAHTEAPTAGSVILAGLLLKTGAYGLIRFVRAAVPRGGAQLRSGRDGPGGGRHPLRRGAGLRADRLQAPGRLHERQPSGVRPARRLRLEPARAAGRGDADARARHQHRRAVRHRGRTAGPHPHARDGPHGRPLGHDAEAWAGPRCSSHSASLGLPGLGNFVGEFLVLLGTWSAQPRAHRDRGGRDPRGHSLRAESRAAHVPGPATCTMASARPQCPRGPGDRRHGGCPALAWALSAAGAQHLLSRQLRPRSRRRADDRSGLSRARAPHRAGTHSVRGHAVDHDPALARSRGDADDRAGWPPPSERSGPRQPSPPARSRRCSSSTAIRSSTPDSSLPPPSPWFSSATDISNSRPATARNFTFCSLLPRWAPPCSPPAVISLRFSWASKYSAFRCTV